MTEAQSFLVDGKNLNIDQVKAIFNLGRVNWDSLANRIKIAATMVVDNYISGELIDIGCYSGAFLEILRTKNSNLNAVGIDSFEDNIAISQLLYPEFANQFKKMSVYAIEYPIESVGFISFLEVIEHLDRPIDAIREINRVLKIGGYLVLTTPNANCDAWRLFFKDLKDHGKKLFGRKKSDPGKAIYFEEVSWNRHIFNWTPYELNALLSINGFELVQFTYCPETFLQRVFPSMSNTQAFLMKKMKPAHRNII